MSVNTICPKCQTLYQNLPEEYVNRSVHCKKCDHRFKAVDNTVSEPQETQLAATTSPVNMPQETQLAPPPSASAPISNEPQETQLASSVSGKTNSPVSKRHTPQETQLASAEQLNQIPIERPDSYAQNSIAEKSIRTKSIVSQTIGLGSEHLSSEQNQSRQSVHDWQIGEVLLERYEIKALLGEGQFGKVFQVWHRDWNLNLALKTPKQKALTASFENIEKEAETWVNLDLHPNIVNCYYVRRIDNVPQIFSEYVDGGDLKELINSKKLYTEDSHKTGQQVLLRILDIAIQFAWGLHYAHEQGLIHQDIKPANVMVTSDGIIKVTDFGLAKASAMADLSLAEGADQDMKQTMIIAGMGMTPAYASPEQLVGRSLTRRTDLWSWGVCVLEMILGYCSWEAGAVAPGILEAYSTNMLDEEPELDSIPLELTALLNHCFQESETDRPVNLEEVAAKLQEIYNNEAVTDYPGIQPRGGSGTASSLNNQAISLLDLGRSDEAVQLWNNALHIEPQHFETIYNHSFFQWQQEGLDESELLEKIEAILSRVKNSNDHKEISRIQNALAELYLQSGHYTRAVKLLNQGNEELTHCPEHLNHDSYKILALAFCADDQLMKKDSHWDVIVQCLKKAMTNELNDPCLTTAYIRALQRSGEKKSALELFKVSTKKGIIPRQLKQAVALFLPGHEVLYRIEKKHVHVVRFINNDENILFNQGNLLILWSLKNKEVILEMKGHLGKVTAIAVSSDKRTLFSGSEHGNIRTWDLVTGQLMAVWSAHKESINVLQLTSCGQFLLVAAGDSRIYLWDHKNKSRMHSFYGEGHSSDITTIESSPLTGQLASGGRDNIVRIWDQKSGRGSQILSGHNLAVTCVQWLDELHVLSASLDKTIRLWNVKSGECLQVYKGHHGMINALQADVNQGYILSGSSDGMLRYWDISTGSSYRLSQFSKTIRAIELDESKLFAMITTPLGISLIETRNSFRYHAAYLFSLPESAAEVDELSRKYQKKIAQAKIALKDDVLFAMQEIQSARAIKGYEREHSTFKLWSDLYSIFQKLKLNDAWKHLVLKMHEQRITALDISPLNDKCYSASKDRHVYQWDVNTLKPNKILSQFKQEISAIKVTSDGAGILVACGETIMLMDIQTGKQLSWFSHHKGTVAAMVVTADGRFALSSDEQGHYYLWRLLTGESMADFTDKNNSVITIAVTPDGRFALTGQRNNNTIVRWDMSTGKIVSEFNEHENIVTSIAVTSDGRYFISASADATLRVWQVESSRKKAVRVLTGHTKRINQVVIDYQAKIALSVSDDHSVRIWDILSGQCLYSFENINVNYTTAILSMDGQYAFTGDTSGSITVWCLDWLLKKKTYNNWEPAADIYIENFFSTHKISHETAEAVKELDNTLRILNYAGYGGIDKNDVGLKLVNYAQSHHKTTLPGSKLKRSRSIEKAESNTANKIIYGLLLLVFVFITIAFFGSDEQASENVLSDETEQSNQIIISDEDEQLTIDKMLDIAVLLAKMNEQTIIFNGRVDRNSLKIPLDSSQLKKMLNLQGADLIDSWGHDFTYQGIQSGMLKGRIILRSGGADQQYKTADDLLLNGFPHWNSLQIRKNNKTVVKLLSLKKEISEQENEADIDIADIDIKNKQTIAAEDESISHTQSIDVDVIEDDTTIEVLIEVEATPEIFIGE